jgi:uroporphyrinogen decarboxylase
MPPRERVNLTLRHEIPDRVPINYSANPGIDSRLKQHLNVKNHKEFLKVLGVDFWGVNPPYNGPRLYSDIPERGLKVDNFGGRLRWLAHGTGGYWEYCDFPLENADEEMVANWKMPSPDHYNYEAAKWLCKQAEDFAVYVGHAGIADIINGNSRLRGMEQTLIDLVTDNPAGLLLAKRRVDLQLEVIRRTIEACGDRVDFLWIGEDLGSQNGPLISPDVFRKHIRPLLQKFVDLARSFDLPVMIHSCGSSSWAFNDFIEMGITAVDTLQPEAKDMSPEFLKSKFGKQLVLHGAITTGGAVAFGTVDEVRKYCKNVLEIMMPGGGYCFAPAHMLQDNTPVENVLAMYEVANKFGYY